MKRTIFFKYSYKLVTKVLKINGRKKTTKRISLEVVELYLFYLVAGTGIEPVTRGFSIQLNIPINSAVSLKKVTSFSVNLSSPLSKSN
jgi:hypothetical protein